MQLNSDGCPAHGAEFDVVEFVFCLTGADRRSVGVFDSFSANNRAKSVFFDARFGISDKFRFIEFRFRHVNEVGRVGLFFFCQRRRGGQPSGISADSLVNDNTSSILLNRATQGAYPPGSIFKVVMSLAYLREHGTLDDFSYDCTGSITEDGHTIPCFDGEVHGEVDFTTAFAESCNTSFVRIGLDLGASAIQKTAEDLLFNKELPISLDYRKSTIDLKKSEGIPFLMQSSIGQGTTLVSPMHMAMITSAIANDGELMKPYYIERVENDAGDEVKTTSPSVYKRLMSESEAETLQNLMEEVVSSGTGTELSGESYSAAGKTGSAEFEASDGSIMTHSWFIGFSNVEDPDLVVAVIAEGAGTGSSVAVPIAHAIFNTYYYG